MVMAQPPDPARFRPNWELGSEPNIIGDGAPAEVTVLTFSH